MALPDIKDAGALAGFAVWGWPYHGVCAGGSITLPNAATYPMTQPPNELTWLIDMGLPPIERNPAELVSDAANGFEWRNYALISGGTIYGTQLPPASFIHVDAVSKCWLIQWTNTTFDAALNTSTLSFDVSEFGVLMIDAVVKPKLPVSLTVSSEKILVASTTYSGFFYAYNGLQMELEDVWTNGARALFGIYNLREPDVHIKDMVSMLEITISGAGGADGSGLIFSGAEIRTYHQLNQPETPVPSPHLSDAPIYDWYQMTGSLSGEGANQIATYIFETITGGNYLNSISSGGMDGLDGEHYPDSFARFAYYKPDGSPVAAKLKYGSIGTWSIDSLVQTLSGSYSYYTQSGVALTNDLTAAHTGISHGILRQGIYLMEDNVVVDKIEYVQNFSENKILSNFFNNGGTVATPTVTENVCPKFDAGYWEWAGHDVSGLTIPLLTDPGQTCWGYREFVPSTLFMNMWRSPIDKLSLIETDLNMGLQRLKRAAGFFVTSGGMRSYSKIMSPYGVVASGITAAENIYLTGNRKTGAIAASENSICYV